MVSFLYNFYIGVKQKCTFNGKTKDQIMGKCERRESNTSGKEGMPAVPTALIGGFSWTRDQLKIGFIREDTVAVSSNADRG